MHMHRLRALLTSLALLLAGCPYGSEFPLGSPAEAIDDTALPGAWLSRGDEDFTLFIRSSGGAELALAAESPGEEPAVYRAYASAVGGERFLSVLEAESGQWYLANYRLQSGRLLLRLVEEELFESRTFASGAELRAFLLQNLEDPRLYGGPETEEWDWVLERAASGD